MGLLVEISDALDGTTGCHGVDEAPKVVAEPRPGITWQRASGGKGGGGGHLSLSHSRRLVLF